jgi:radical SAM protein with 4Fe4S-binding SPASM domain
MSRELIGSGLTGIMFSIDAGTAQTYKKIRRSDDFDKVVQNVVDFQAQKEKLGSKLPLTRVSFVDNKINHAELGDFVTFWQNKIDFIVVQSFCNPFIGTNRYKEIEKKYRINNKPFDVCAESYRRMTITCDGNIFPCCIYFGLELQMGNIYENSIHDVWNGEKMEQLRLLVNGAKDMQPEACRKCRASVVSCKQEK